VLTFRFSVTPLLDFPAFFFLRCGDGVPLKEISKKRKEPPSLPAAFRLSSALRQIRSKMLLTGIPSFPTFFFFFASRCPSCRRFSPLKCGKIVRRPGSTCSFGEDGLRFFPPLSF